MCIWTGRIVLRSSKKRNEIMKRLKQTDYQKEVAARIYAKMPKFAVALFEEEKRERERKKIHKS